MYGPSEAYMKSTVFRSNGNHRLALEYRGKKLVAIRAHISYGMSGGITETLKPCDSKRGIFLLSDRKADTVVPMSHVTKRHSTYPVGSFIKLGEMNDVKDSDHCTGLIVRN